MGRLSGQPRTAPSAPPRAGVDSSRCRRAGGARVGPLGRGGAEPAARAPGCYGESAREAPQLLIPDTSPRPPLPYCVGPGRTELACLPTHGRPIQLNGSSNWNDSG
ncbi:hypothetical protein Y1Q_0011047 [Alligator mississippiensis]|uniref:Uncharacterized protein n=1 Tax=Alligator mississippiensis TaxID=8496 RepID=A0A151NXQ1_ALLMI|nr:hypothetical protein Y1Q_0011047 [Alligator mississippiensis]